MAASHGFPAFRRAGNAKARVYQSAIAIANGGPEAAAANLKPEGLAYAALFST